MPDPADDHSAVATRKRNIHPEVAAARAKTAAYARRGNHEAADAARADLAEAKLAAHIKRVVDGAPPLTQAQRDRLALLLRPGSGGARAAS